jgi:hypothetical protein
MGRLLRELAQEVLRAHTQDGLPVRDASDFRRWLEELAATAEAER